MISLISPENGISFSILSEIQKEFIAREFALKEFVPDSVQENAYPWYDISVCGTPGISHPASLIFKWKLTDHLHPAKIELSLNENFLPEERIGAIASVGKTVYNSEDGTYYTSVSNFLSGETYYWRVVSDVETSEARTFSTKIGEIRTIRAEGLDNIRDFGGRINTEGRRVKQGLIYRGGALNYLSHPDCAENNGLHVMRDDLKIKTDIDLRFEAIGKYEFCQLGDHINYNLLPSNAYDGLLEPYADETFRKIFELIADENNYPIYIHCVAGADRTGSVGFLLDALLGMSEEEIILNYNMTAICEVRNWYRNSDIIKMVSKLKELYPDKTLTDMLVEYLRHAGLSDETLQRIRDNLLE